MSNLPTLTPRTDAAIYQEDTGHNGMVDVVPPEFARELERELSASQSRRQQLLSACKTALTDIKQINDVAEGLLKQRDELRAKIDAAEAMQADKRRLDWMELTADGIDWQLNQHTRLINRAAIDTAMAASNQSGKVTP